MEPIRYNVRERDHRGDWDYVVKNVLFGNTARENATAKAMGIGYDDLANIIMLLHRNRDIESVVVQPRGYGNPDFIVELA